MAPELRDLPADLRDTVRFYHIDGFSLDEIALLTGVAKETARSRLRKATEALAADDAARPMRQEHTKHMVRA
ncbi:MAG: hypothetical protein JWO38_8261 [Gemmataceae bacterium]|nr:hypothetical protein [Gemmataceae bacterium]